MAFKRAGADAILTYAAPWASRKIIGAVPTLPAEGDPAQAPEASAFGCGDVGRPV